MSKYEQLVKALRCGEYKPECGSSDCLYWSGLGCMDGQLMEDAAAAIEELQAELDQWKAAVKGQEDGIKVLQAEMKRLKEANDELREAQTYIDHYGDKWLTSAKDVPTSAYNHGYMDGKNEAEQALEPKMGEWIRIDKHTIQCPLCHRYLDLRGVNAGRGDANYCPNCGAKMEVQDGSSR